MKLSIVIPTYNRNTTLAANLPSLLRQLTPECELIIIDNASTIPVAETLSQAKLIEDQAPGRVTVMRNRLNIGGNANILRCHECGIGDWVWTIGDDDLVADGAVDSVLGYLSAYPTAAFINFHSVVSHVQRPKDYTTTGRLEFLYRMQQLTAITFMSVCVYRRSQIGSGLKYAYQFSYSSAPHVVLVLMALRPDSICVFATFEPIRQISVDCDQNQSYAEVPIALALPTLLYLPLRPEEKRELKILLGRLAQVWLVRARLFRELLFNNASTGAEKRFSFLRLRRDFYSMNHTWKGSVENAIYGVMLWFPATSLKLYRKVYGVLKHGRVIAQRVTSADERL